jgi:Flp pilus assembly protein TadG
VIVTFAFTALSIIAALVIDVGIAYYKTAEIENAADAAALAAGQQLPVDVNDTAAIIQIKNIAVAYANKNGITELGTDDVALSGIVNGYYTQLNISITAHSATTFARVIGIDSLDFTRGAKVKITPTMKVTDAVPLSIIKANMDIYIANNQTTHLVLKFGAGGSVTGAFGAIDLDGVNGGGANDYEMWLAYGYTSALSVGDQLYPVESGNMAGPTNSALNIRYSGCTHFQDAGGCSIDHYSISCCRVVKVPVIEYIGKKNARICGFAAFVLEPPAESGYVYGSFVKMVVPGSPSETVTVGDVLDYGLYNVKLCE